MADLLSQSGRLTSDAGMVRPDVTSGSRGPAKKILASGEMVPAGGAPELSGGLLLPRYFWFNLGIARGPGIAGRGPGRLSGRASARTSHTAPGNVGRAGGPRRRTDRRGPQAPGGGGC